MSSPLVAAAATDAQPSEDERLRVLGSTAGFEAVLTPEALAFVGRLCAVFRPRVGALLARRREAQAAFDAGEPLAPPEDSAAIREAAWTVAPIPPDLRDRRVEITGPVDAKMIINALNSGANVFMADFEDATSPTWHNLVSGQANLCAAVRRTLTWRDEARDKDYALAPEGLATLFVRPRGLHLPERHIELGGTPVPGALVDFGLFFFHNARELVARGTGPYFYLPKLQSHLEARLWNDVFVHAQELLGLPQGTIRATVLVETLPAAFEMDEILWELRDHSAGLNCGRWDYIFSFIKTLRAHGRYVLPDRGQVTMTQPNMAAYTAAVVEICHRRGVHAMGGMAAQIPIKNDEVANAVAIEKVRADKIREVLGGHDGTWVAHPGLIAVARAAFDQHMTGPNQIGRPRTGHRPSPAELLSVPTGSRTEAGLRHNVRVGIRYLEAWLRGQGCVPLYDLMEDAATAEISRAQVWQWLHHRVDLDSDGRPLDPGRLNRVIDEELARIRGEVGASEFEGGRFPLAREIFERIATDRELADFLTLAAYEHIVSVSDSPSNPPNTRTP